MWSISKHCLFLFLFIQLSKSANHILWSTQMPSSSFDRQYCFLHQFNLQSKCAIIGALNAAQAQPLLLTLPKTMAHNGIGPPFRTILTSRSARENLNQWIFHMYLDPCFFTHGAHNAKKCIPILFHCGSIFFQQFNGSRILPPIFYAAKGYWNKIFKYMKIFLIW